jgi:hypothetical protein
VTRNELLAADERHISERCLEVFKMTPLLLICIAAIAPVAGVGLMQLQSRLEQWDYERHAED